MDLLPIAMGYSSFIYTVHRLSIGYGAYRPEMVSNKNMFGCEQGVLCRYMVVTT